jgi:hypothetical protein
MTKNDDSTKSTLSSFMKGVKKRAIFTAINIMASLSYIPIRDSEEFTEEKRVSFLANLNPLDIDSETKLSLIQVYNIGNIINDISLGKSNIPRNTICEDIETGKMGDTTEDLLEQSYMVLEHVLGSIKNLPAIHAADPEVARIVSDAQRTLDFYNTMKTHTIVEYSSKKKFKNYDIIYETVSPKGIECVADFDYLVRPVDSLVGIDALIKYNKLTKFNNQDVLPNTSHLISVKPVSPSIGLFSSIGFEHQ